MPKYKKRPDGLYRADINLGRRSDGKYNRKTVYAPTIRELENKIQAIKNEANNGILSGEAQKITFEQLSNIWLDSFTPNASQRTRANYRSLLRGRVWSVFGDRYINTLVLSDLQKVLNEEAKRGISKSTLTKIKGLSTAIMNLAIDNRLIMQNPFTKAKIPDVKAKKRTAITEEQRDIIIKYWRGHRMGLAAMIMLLCGLRRGELFALEWSDIDLENNRITINKAIASNEQNFPYLKKPKTDSGIRVVPIPQILKDALKCIECKQGLLYPAPNGDFIRETTFAHAWQGYLSYLNQCAGGKKGSRWHPPIIKMQPFTPHQLRHTYATLLYSSGVDILTAQYLLGHSDFKITMGIYTHLEQSKKQYSIQQLNEYLNDNCGKIAVKDNEKK